MSSEGGPVAASLGESLRADEHALRSARASARASVLSERAVSYGVGVRGTPAYLARARELGVPVVRRTTGGTGLLHLPGDIVWSIVLPRTDPRVGRDFVRAYDRLGQGVVRVLAELGVESRWSDPPGLADDYCPLSGRGAVLWARSRIVGAAAQHLSRDALLHQGSLSLTIDRPLVARLFDIADPTIPERLGGLTELRPPLPSPEPLARRLAAALSDGLERSG